MDIGHLQSGPRHAPQIHACHYSAFDQEFIDYYLLHSNIILRAYISLSHQYHPKPKSSPTTTSVTNLPSTHNTLVSVSNLRKQANQSLMMHRYRRNTVDSVTGVFSLNPMPFPVLLLLGVIFFFLGLQWYVSYESMVETTEESMGWILLAVPLVLILAVKLLSSMESPERFLWAPSPWDRHRRMRYQYSEGSSPWGVAALILLLLVLVQYQSSFLDRWFI